MHRGATGIGGWALRAIAAACVIAGVTRLSVDTPAPRFSLSPAPVAARTTLPKTAASDGIRSVLKVPLPMRYGEFVWHDTDVSQGRVWVRVDRRAQLISVFRGGDEIGTAVILYGAPEAPTPAGRYPVLEKRRVHFSSLYDASMPYTLRLTADGVSIHASNVREGAATHGCIGLPDEFARRLFDQAQVGTEVVIV